MPLFQSALLALLVVGGVSAENMLAVRARGFCEAPFDDCVNPSAIESRPPDKEGYALIMVNASSVNPSDVDTVEGGLCTLGCGSDIAGTVVSCPGCASVKAGDEVWTCWTGSNAFAEYAQALEDKVSIRPQSISFTEAASIPQAGLTSYITLKRTGPATPPGTPLVPGNPWINKSNVTVVITAGSGGTGFVGIQLAKAWGATRIVTASTGEGVDFCYALGATLVVDYKEQDVFTALADDSVDYVYDNYGEEGTADVAMRTIRSGGVYILLPHSECFVTASQEPPCLSADPKPGVSQFNYSPETKYAKMGLDEMAGMFDAGVLSPRIDSVYPMSNIAAAFNRSAGSGAGGTSSHYGKIGVEM